jgi:lipopolysaccharide exporter
MPYTPSDTIDEVEDLQQADLLDELQLQDIKKKSVSGAASYFLRTILLNAIGLAASFVLSWYFSPEDFAVYGYVIQFIGLLVFFSDIGLAASLIQKKDKPTLTDYRTAFTVQQFLSWVIFGITLLIAKLGIIQNNVGPDGVWILLALGISFPLASLKTISAIKLERKLDFSKLVMPQILEQLIFNGLLIGLAISGKGVIAYAWAILARSVVGAIAMFLIRPWKIGISFNLKSFKELMNFGVKFQVNDLLARVKDNLFYIVLLRFMSPAQYGYISWSKQWSMYPYNLTVNNVMAITFPTFSRLQHNKDALRKAIEKSIFFITLAIFPMIVGMSLFIGPLTQAMSGFNKWQPAIMSFVFFTMSIGFSALSSPLTNTLNAIGKIGITLKLMVMWTILTWVVTPIMMKFFGYNGVAMAALLIAFTSVIPIYYVKKIVKINVWEQIWRQLLASVVMIAVGILGYQVWGKSLFYLIIGMALVGSSYGLSWLIIGRDKLWGEVRSLLNK